jgi:mycothiol synthase
VQDTPPSPLLTALAAVHPDQRGQGIGTALCRWIEERCRQALARLPVGTSATVLQQVASTDRAARDLLIAQGYRVARHSFRMVLEMDASPAAPLDPEGIVLRPLVRETEAKALVQALREAFRDNWGYVERPFEVEYERWMNLLDREDGAETARYWLVAVDGSEIAGFALSRPRAGENPEDASLYVVGVRPAWRRRGIALALLQRTFRALYQGGARRVRLEVDAQNRTGATRLYEKVGMRLESRDDFYEKQLHPGEA